MSGNCTSWLPVETSTLLVKVLPWSVERLKNRLTPPFPLNRDHEKYTFPSQGPLVRSTSMAVLSLKVPSRFGADEPFSTTTERLNSLPSWFVGPFVPCGFS